jgi:ribonuclease HI
LKPSEPQVTPARATLFTDGGARGNPGPSGIGAVLRDDAGEVVGEISQSIGHATNNIAEYKALIEGLTMAIDKGVTELDVFLDSELVVHQMRGEWKIKHANLRTLAIKAQGLMRRFDSISIAHVRREQNAEADALANQAMDAAALNGDEDPSNIQSSFFE